MGHLALQLFSGGDLTGASVRCRALLADAPAAPLPLHILGLIANQHGDHESAVRLLGRAYRCQPRIGAEALALALNSLAVSLYQQNRIEEAIGVYRRVTALKPDDTEVWINFGGTLQSQGRFIEAERCYRQAIAHRPCHAMVHNALGLLLQTQGRLEEAEACYRRAIITAPDDSHAYNNLGALLKLQHRQAEALTRFRRTAVLSPDSSGVFSNLATSFRALGRFDEAKLAGMRAIALAPNYVGAFNALGSLLLSVRQLDPAITCFERAITLRPDRPEPHSNLIFALDQHPAADTARLQDERRRWSRHHGAPLTPPRPWRHANDPNPARRLRVGYVSADFRFHSAATAFSPVLLNHDPAQIELVCYANSAHQDGLTARLRAAAALWRPVAALTNTELADLIRSDAIDILVDLSGHSSGNRLQAFALKPAPVQVTAWGLASGTGLETIDALFSDPVCIPPHERALITETVVDLPCLMCYQPPPLMPETGERTPAGPGEETGAITFGCLNRLSKVSDEALDLWGTLLARDPHARLLIKDPGLESEEVRAALLNRLTRAGAPAERISLLGRTPQREHLETYRRVDIALDPFPHNGGISTLEALWMGVPVLTLCGTTLTGRVSSSFLTVLGLTDWIATTQEEYLRLARIKAADTPALHRLRTSLRARATASPIGDVAAYTRAVELAYRRLWRDWCQSVKGT